MNEHGIKDYRDLIKRSTDDIEWFWNAAVEELNVEWFEKPRKVLDATEVQWAKWFIEGRLNITHNCLDKHAKSWRKNNKKY